MPRKLRKVERARRPVYDAGALDNRTGALKLQMVRNFIAAGKAVFHCEYGTTTSSVCNKVPAGFSTIVKNLDLDAFRLACP